MTSRNKPDCVTVGCWVRINDPGIGEETIHLVDQSKESPERGRLSPNSPFVQAMLGAKQGEAVSFETPNGSKEEFTVLEFGWDS